MPHALRCSGTGGLILRPFRVDGPSPHSVVWLPVDLATVLQAAASFPTACGVVANARGLGVRVPAMEYPAAFAALRKAPPPPPKLYYELAGLPLGMTAEPLAAALLAEGWTATPLRTFVRSRRRVWVLQAETPPEFDLLATDDGLATLQAARDRPPRPQPTWQKVTARSPVPTLAPHPPVPTLPRRRPRCSPLHSRPPQLGPTAHPQACSLPRRQPAAPAQWPLPRPPPNPQRPRLSSCRRPCGAPPPSKRASPRWSSNSSSSVRRSSTTP